MCSRSVVLGPTLETERLILRPPVAGDFDAFAAMMMDEAATRFLGGAQPRAIAWRTFASLMGSWVILGFGVFSVLEKSSGCWVGRLGPIHPDGWPGDEIAYGLAREFWGRGYAQEGCVAAIDWACFELGWTDFIHSISPENIASRALAKRLGAVNRGPGQLPAPYDDIPIEIWGQTRAEWIKQRRRFGSRTA